MYLDPVFPFPNFSQILPIFLPTQLYVLSLCLWQVIRLNGDIALKAIMASSLSFSFPLLMVCGSCERDE